MAPPRTSRQANRFCFREIATSCNRSIGGAAFGAVSANFEPADHNVKAALALDLSFQAIEEITLKLGNLSATQTSHVDVVTLRPALVKVLLALHMHQVKLVN